MASGWSTEKSYPHVPLFSHNVAHYFGNQGLELPIVVILKGRSASEATEPDFTMCNLCRDFMKRSCFSCYIEFHIY